MTILVLNCGSSTIKFRVFASETLNPVISGIAEDVGARDARLSYTLSPTFGVAENVSESIPAKYYRKTLRIVVDKIVEFLSESTEPLHGIGHRLVHGGDQFKAATLVDENVIREIGRLSRFAPLHNEAGLAGIDVCAKTWPHMPQVAVFDTAFHQAIPEHAFRYAIPEQLYRQYHIRRFGFHGTSHRWAVDQAARLLGLPESSLNLVTLHLGSGASAAAIKNGRCIDTSMGMTPLEGLIMGTRCGDIDPAIVIYLANETGKSLDEIEDLLSRESGLKGICGESDMRRIHQMADKGDHRARLAIDMMCYRVKKYIGSYIAVLERVDAIVFTGGIGENDARIRATICHGLANLGLRLDDSQNQNITEPEMCIHEPGSPVKICVIAANEELEIARQALETIPATRPSPEHSQ